jgi:hypothetical protein
MRTIKSERINLLARSHGYFPAAFRWRGRRFEVAVVEKCWTVQRPTVHRMFRVRCTAGSFVLEQYLVDDTWRVSRWPLALLLPWSKPAASVRFPLPHGQRRPARQSQAGRAGHSATPVQAQVAARP